MAVNGSIVSASTVDDGARLQGIGTLGQVTVLSGGVYAPGNSSNGTQSVVAPFTLNAGAIYEVEVNAAGQGDRVFVNGTVSLSGAVLRVLAENGNYNPSTNYVIIANDGADPVTGTFASVTTGLALQSLNRPTPQCLPPRPAAKASAGMVRSPE